MLKKLLLSLIVLNVSHSLFAMSPGSLPEEIIVQIVSRPNNIALENIFKETRFYQSGFTQYNVSYLQIRDALMPGFNILRTCTQYNLLKIQAKNKITGRYFPQGFMFFLLPKSLQLNVFKEVPSKPQADQLLAFSLFQKENVIKELIDKCFNDNVSYDVLFMEVKLLKNCDDIIYNHVEISKENLSNDQDYFESYTLIEYLYREFFLKLVCIHRPQNEFCQALKNFWIVMNTLCLLKKTDLALPSTAHLHESIETYLYNKFQVARPTDKPESCTELELLSFQASVKSIYERPAEHKHVINALINLYLF